FIAGKLGGAGRSVKGTARRPAPPPASTEKFRDRFRVRPLTCDGGASTVRAFGVKPFMHKCDTRNEEFRAARLFPAEGPCRPHGGVPRAPRRRLAGDARRPRRGGLAQLLALPARGRPARR